jgi:hypothetical protein
VRPLYTETSTISSSLLTESSSPAQIAHETEASNTTTGTPTQPELKQELPVTDVPNPVSIKADELLEVRRNDASGRKFDSSQTSGSRKRNGGSSILVESQSSANTRQPTRRPPNYIDKIPKVSDDISRISTSSDNLLVDIPRIEVGFVRGTTTTTTTTTDPPPDEGERRLRSGSRKNVAEVSPTLNEPRSRSRVSAQTQRSVEATQQRTYHRGFVRSGGSRTGTSADGVPSSNPQATARDFAGRTSSRTRDMTQPPLKDRNGNTRSRFRGEDFELHKVKQYALLGSLLKFMFFKTETNSLLIKS